MAFKVAPRARQTCTAPGLGAMVVSGTVQGAQTFASYLSNGDTTWAVATNGTAWEEGNATYASGANSLTFIVDADFRSSNSNALVNFSTGTVDVSCDLISLRAKVLERLLWAAAAVTPPTNDGAALGTGALAFSDLFLADGGVLNFNNGNYTVTHSAGLLAFSGNATIGGTFGVTGNFSVNTNKFNITASSGATSVAGLITASGGITATNAGPTIGTPPIKATGAVSELSLSLANSGTNGREWQVISSAGASGLGQGFISLYDATTGGVTGARLQIDSAGAVYLPGVSTTASAANAFINNASTPANSILRSTSSLRYKKDVEPLADEYADAILQLSPIWYRSKAEADNPEWSWYGLAAEEVAKIDPRLVHWTYPDEAYELVDVEIDVPEMEDVEVVEMRVEGDVVIRRIVKAQRQKTVVRPVLLENGEPSTVEGPDGEPIPETIEVPVMRKQTRQERRLKDGAVKVPDSVMYDRIAVLLLSVVKRMQAKK